MQVVERLIATELQRVAFPPLLPLDWQAQMNDTAQLDRLQPGYLCHELMRQQSMPFEYSPQLSSCSRLPSSHAHEPAGPCTPALASAAQLVRPRPLPGQLSAMALDAGMPDNFLPAPEALSPPPALLMTTSGASTFIAPTHGAFGMHFPCQSCMTRLCTRPCRNPQDLIMHVKCSSLQMWTACCTSPSQCLTCINQDCRLPAWTCHVTSRP